MVEVDEKRLAALEAVYDAAVALIGDRYQDIDVFGKLLKDLAAAVRAVGGDDGKM